jgi:hypothetical protein
MNGTPITCNPSPGDQNVIERTISVHYLWGRGGDNIENVEKFE